MGSTERCAEHKGLGIKAKKCLYEEVIVPTAWYEAEEWGMRRAEKESECSWDQVFEKFPVHDAVGINCKKGATTENQGAGVKYMG